MDYKEMINNCAKNIIERNLLLKNSSPSERESILKKYYNSSHMGDVLSVAFGESKTSLEIMQDIIGRLVEIHEMTDD